MIYVTESFIDQVIYTRVSALALKGSVYTSLHVQDLIEFKKQVVGERILLQIEQASDDVLYRKYLDDRVGGIEKALEKIRFLADMDGMDTEPSGEAIDIFLSEIAGVTDG